MQQPDLNWIANFIWGIADDVLRDLYVRGKYRDVILPMTVLRRLDVVLEPTKQDVLKMKESLDKAGIVRQETINDLPLGRSVEEILRLVDALQHTEKHGEVCPAGWNKGKQAMKANPKGVASFLKDNADKL